MKRIMVAALAAVLLGTGFMSSAAEAQWSNNPHAGFPGMARAITRSNNLRSQQLAIDRQRMIAQHDFQRARDWQMRGEQDRIRTQMMQQNLNLLRARDAERQRTLSRIQNPRLRNLQAQQFARQDRLA